jgi:hypothetical protein
MSDMFLFLSDRLYLAKGLRGSHICGYYSYFDCLTCPSLTVVHTAGNILYSVRHVGPGHHLTRFRGGGGTTAGTSLRYL